MIWTRLSWFEEHLMSKKKEFPLASIEPLSVDLLRYIIDDKEPHPQLLDTIQTWVKPEDKAKFRVVRQMMNKHKWRE